MSYSKLSIVMLISACFITPSAYAEGVFLAKNRVSHKLSKTEVRKIKIEFLQKFGSTKPMGAQTSANPWLAKKERKKNQKVSTVSWGECRDYSLQKRNRCYKEGRQAYYCERYYEARSEKCNEDY